MGPAWTAQGQDRQEVQTRSQTEKPLLPRLLPCRGEASSQEASSCRSVLPEEAPLQARAASQTPRGHHKGFPGGEVGQGEAAETRRG